MLTARLKTLADDGLAGTPPVPDESPRHEYVLTELGHSLRPVIVAPATFYLYFRDKVDVLLRVITSVKAGIFEAGAVWHPNEGGLDGLARTYESMIKHYREHAAFLAAINKVAAYEPVVREAWLADQDRFIDRTAELLVEEQEAGRTPSAIDPVRAATMIVRGGAQITALHVATSDGANDALVARELAYEHWYGVYRRPS